MKKYTLLLFLIGFCAFSQQRIDEDLPVISQTTSKLTTALGWLKNSSGQWLSRKNKIIQDLGENTIGLENYEKYSLGEANFIYFELKKVNINNVSYDMLVKKYRSGYYTYPNIQRDWNKENVCSYYVFKSDIVKEMKEAKADTLNTIYLDVKYTGYISFVTDKTNINDAISKDIAKKIKSESTIYGKSSSVLALNIYYNDKIVQFYPYNNHRDNSGNINNSNDFKDRYYETDLLNFNKFIKLQ